MDEEDEDEDKGFGGEELGELGGNVRGSNGSGSQIKCNTSRIK